MGENATEGVTGMTWDGFKSMSMIMIKTRITTITITMILYDFLQYDTITILQKLTVVYSSLPQLTTKLPIQFPPYIQHSNYSIIWFHTPNS